MLRLMDGSLIRTVSVYAPNNRTDGLLCVAAQHRNFLNSKGILDTTPVIHFWSLLAEQLQEWIADGNEIVLTGDINENVSSEIVKRFFEEFNVVERLTSVHNNTLETYVRNNSGRTIDGI